MEEQQAPFDESSSYSAGSAEGPRDTGFSSIEQGQKIFPHDRFVKAPRRNQFSRGSLREGKGVALAGLILAVAALVVLLLTPLVGVPALVVAFICSLAGLGLSAVGYRSPSARPIARVALVLALIEVVLVVLLLLLATPVSIQSHPQ
jgi:hypothetical protein